MHRLPQLAVLAFVAVGSSFAHAEEGPPPAVAVSAPLAIDGTDPSVFPVTLDPSTASPSDPAPPGYHTEKRQSRAGFVAGGLTMFGVSYGLSAAAGAVGAMVVSSANANDSDEWGCAPHCSLAPAVPFFVPVVGPFIVAADGASNGSGAVTAIVIADGLLQAGGVAMLVYGLTGPERTVLVRDRAARPYGFTWMPAPIVGNGQEGVALVGKF